MSTPSLPESVRANIEAYFKDLGANEPANMHDMLLRTVETVSYTHLTLPTNREV